MKKWTPLWFALFLAGASIALLLPVSSFAQGSFAALGGRVTDETGSVIAGAKIAAVNTSTNQTFPTETNSDGLYTLPELPPGTYQITAEKTGFSQQIRTGLELHVADSTAIDFVLKVGSVSQSVTVSAGAPLVNTTSSTLGGLVDETKVDNLPLNGRNVDDLTLLSPGVARNTNFSQTHGITGTYFSSSGAPVRSNNYLLDGTSMQQLLGGAPTGAVGLQLGLDGIEEYTVVTNGADAQYGQTMGAHIVILSRSGTNEWHGGTFEYLRNAAMDARNYFDLQYLVPGSGVKRLPHFERNNFGGSLGGPIKKDKAFLFVNYEGLRQIMGATERSNTIGAGCHGAAGAVIWNGQGSQPAGSLGPCTQLGSNPGGAGTNSVAIPTVMAPFLLLYPNPNIPGTNQFTYNANNLGTEDFGQIRFDQRFSASDSFFARYTIDNSELDSAAAFPEWRTANTNRAQYLTLSENHIFSQSLLNTARLGFSRTGPISANVFPNVPGYPSLVNNPDYELVPGEPFTTISVTTLSSLVGVNSDGPPPDAERQNIYSLSDDLVYTIGKHELRFGTLLNRFNDNIQGGLRPDGQLTFPSVAGFLQGQASSYQGVISGAIFNKDYWFNTFGFYAQDNVRLTPRLTINAGLRYEFATAPSEANNRGYAIRNILTDSAAKAPVMDNYTLHDFSPRVGFAFDPTGSGKTSIRSAFGIFYDIANLGEVLEQNLLGTPPFDTPCAGTFSSPLYQLTTLPLPASVASNCATLFTTEYNARQPYSMQYNLTVDRQLPGRIGLSVSYVGLQGRHLWTAGEGNPVLLPMAASLSGNAYVPGNTYYSTIANGVPYWSTTILGTPTVPGCANVNPAITPTCRANSNFDAANYVNTSGSSSYNALQVNLNRQLTQGLELQTAFTWANSMDTTQGISTVLDCSLGSAVSPDPQLKGYGKGRTCTGLKDVLKVNLVYYFPNMHSDSIVGKMLHGWWTASIVTAQSGFYFTPTYGGMTNRSQSGAADGLVDQGDFVDFGTTTATATFSCSGTASAYPVVGAPACGSQGTPGKVTYTFVPYNPKTVITGNPGMWFNPFMFMNSPIVPCPGMAMLNCGTLGTAGRNSLEGPGLAEWDLTIAKDTRLPFLGEKGILQFRMDFFNILNHANFSLPSNSVFTGATADTGSYSEAPLSTAGQITSTATTSRQLQAALRISF